MPGSADAPLFERRKGDVLLLLRRNPSMFHFTSIAERWDAVQLLPQQFTARWSKKRVSKIDQ
jgi:hypothetical protein